MKKVVSIILSFIIVFSLAGCTNDELNESIKTLETQVTTLESTESSLNEAKSLLEAKVKELEMNLETVKTENAQELEEEIEFLKETIASLEIELESAKSDNHKALEAQITDLETELEGMYDGAIILQTESNIRVINFVEAEEKSLFDIISETDIELEYDESDYGKYITKIGDCEADLFHWISLSINGASAAKGVEEVEYENGDVIVFSEEIVKWDKTILSTYVGDGGSGNLQFTASTGEEFFIAQDRLPSEFTSDYFIIGAEYTVVGQSEVAIQGWGCSNCIVPTSIQQVYVTDFTDLFDLEIGDTVYLQFTIASISNGWVWGSEIKATDVNGMNSKDVTSHLKDPFSSGYLFYTFPDELDISEGKTYVAKLTFDLFPPNSKGQLGFEGIDANGNVDYSSIEMYELDENGSIVRSVVTSEEEVSTPEGVQSFLYIRDHMNAGDQCQVEFTVTSISWSTPQATDSFGNKSTDVMGYFFDPSWSSTEVDKTYIVTVEKLANGQIKLISELIEKSE